MNFLPHKQIVKSLINFRNAICKAKSCSIFTEFAINNINFQYVAY